MNYLRLALFAGAMASTANLSAEVKPVVQPAAVQEETFAGKIFTIYGVVEYRKAGSNVWKQADAPYTVWPDPAPKYQTLETGDRIRTGPRSRAEIYIKYGTKIRLFSNSIFLLDQVSGEKNLITILAGRMQAWIRKAAGRRFTVRTPTAVCAIRGTMFEVEVTNTGKTIWSLFAGAIQVFDSQNNTRYLAANQRVSVTKANGVTQPKAIPAEVKIPIEPKKIKEEIAEIYYERKEQQRLNEEKRKKAEDAEKEETQEENEEIPAIPEPETTVIPTQEVQESCEMSGSTPGCN